MSGKVKKWYEGIPFIKIPIEEKRKKLLKDELVISLLKAAHLAGLHGESFDMFYKSMNK